MLRLIRELASGERVVVVATHDTRMPLADRVVELMPHVTYTEHEPGPSHSSPAKRSSNRAPWATASMWWPTARSEIVRRIGKRR